MLFSYIMSCRLFGLGCALIFAFQLAAEARAWNSVKAVAPGTPLRVSGPRPGAIQGVLQSVTDDSLVLKSGRRSGDVLSDADQPHLSQGETAPRPRRAGGSWVRRRYRAAARGSRGCEVRHRLHCSEAFRNRSATAAFWRRWRVGRRRYSVRRLARNLQAVSG